MFLSRLYKHSKPMFFALVLFLLVFVILNIKWGAVASPVYQYGMFSGPMHIGDTQHIYQLYINNKPVNISRYPFAQRDMLQVSLQRYAVEKERNLATYATIKKILTSLGIGHTMSLPVYTNNITDSSFTAWYKYLTEHITGEKITGLTVYSRFYTWNGALQPIGPPQKVSFIVTD